MTCDSDVSSYAGLTRVSITLRKAHFSMKMDGRVFKREDGASRLLPGHDGFKGYSPTPNNAAKCFSPLRVKLTMRLPGAESRAAHFSSANRVIMAAPSVPAR